MCSICRKNPCDARCPNYIPLKARYYCSVCNDGIYDGEEYVENDIGERAHWNCLRDMKELLEFLKYNIEIMEEDYD